MRNHDAAGADGLRGRLSEARERAGLSQRALSEQAGLVPGAVGGIERGTNTNPGTMTIAAIASVLNVDLDWLVLGQKPDAPRCPAPVPSTCAAASPRRARGAIRRTAAALPPPAAQGPWWPSPAPGFPTRSYRVAVIPRANTHDRSEGDMGKNESAGLHARDDGPAESEREVDSGPIPSTQGKPEGPRLTAARGRAKRIYRRAVLDGSSLRREAGLLGRHHSYLGQLIDDGDPATPSLAHVLAGSRDVRRAVGLQLQADADADPTVEALPVPLPDQALLLQEDLGQLAGTMRRAMADKHLDREELLALLEDGQRLLANGNAFCRDVRKALDALDGAR